MSHCTKVMLLLVAMVSICAAQRQRAGNTCLCQELKHSMSRDSKIFKYYEPSVFCNKVEIIVRQKDGVLYCLNPHVGKGLMIVQQMEEKKRHDALSRSSSQLASL